MVPAVLLRMERITLRVFFGCLITCALTIITVIWMGDDSGLPEYVFQGIATLFILGLANFLTWCVCITYRLLQLLGQR